MVLDPDPRNSDTFWQTLVANVAAFADEERDRSECRIALDEYANMFEILMYASKDGS